MIFKLEFIEFGLNCVQDENNFIKLLLHIYTETEKKWFFLTYEKIIFMVIMEELYF